ncbi:hypothetical protein [Pedobacter boryungensis]|uniref:Uncharacterized protein n=1 Tax=Pedobacter boryungensis TaxID=869962 RepID=A0ABX2D929_9SPHI|nr:hypothetical protein [Pedobacter boryungensis]NQX30568.1 hypothetical protein [Pedobacter boryungensis]
MEYTVSAYTLRLRRTILSENSIIKFILGNEWELTLVLKVQQNHLAKANLFTVLNGSDPVIWVFETNSSLPSRASMLAFLFPTIHKAFGFMLFENKKAFSAMQKRLIMCRDGRMTYVSLR